MPTQPSHKRIHIQSLLLLPLNPDLALLQRAVEN